MTTKLDLVLINPCSRPQVYQSLGHGTDGRREPRVGRPDGDVLPAPRACPSKSSTPRPKGWTTPRWPSASRTSTRCSRPSSPTATSRRASTQIMTAAGKACWAVKERDAGHAAHAARRPRRRPAGADAPRGGGRLRRRRRGAVHARRAGRSAARVRCPPWRTCRGCGYRDAGKVRTDPGKPLRRRPRRARCPASPGICCRWPSTGRTTGTASAAGPAALRGPVHDAGLPVPLLVLLHPGPVQERRGSRRRQAVGQQLPRLESPDRVIAQIDTLVNKYGVRNIKIADEMFVLNRRHVLGICDRIIERGYDLNIWAYTRVDTIKDGMLRQAEGGRVQLAGRRHRGRVRPRPRRCR